jgi:hypothetical protein
LRRGGCARDWVGFGIKPVGPLKGAREGAKSQRKAGGRVVFDRAVLAKTLDMHERAFALLRWVREALRSGGLSFVVVHRATDSATAATEWLMRHLPAIPRDARPAVEELDAFARLFVSFLTTSYKLTPTATRLVSDCGCYCDYCLYLRTSPSLEVRVASKKDFQTAKQLKRIYVGRLATELGIQASNEKVEGVVNSSALHQQVALATWAAELLRRSEFASQGEAVLALWREFSWENGKPKQNFRLTAESVIAAENAVCRELTG